MCKMPQQHDHIDYKIKNKTKHNKAENTITTTTTTTKTKKTEKKVRPFERYFDTEYN